MNQAEYESLKLSVRGFYYKFNTEILKWYMKPMFGDYEVLLETAKDFENFEDYYNFHAEGKDISKYVEKMYNEAFKKGLNPTKELVDSCVKVRLGNIYNGMFIENKIIESFSVLNEWIKIEKTSKEIDTQYKVDAIIQLGFVGEIAIQIKPWSFTKYDGVSENKSHDKFHEDFKIPVFYVFYKDKENIIFHGNDVRLNQKGKIIEIIETLVYSNI